MEELKIIEKTPTVKQFIDLRRTVGFPITTQSSIKTALQASLYSVCVLDGDTLVGFGRVIGDGGLYLYIQDLMIHPNFQGKGLGKAVLLNLLNFIDKHAESGAFIGLMSAKGKEPFYNKFGFIERPNDAFGAGMCIYKK